MIVGILRGGRNNYENSLQKGKELLKHIKDSKDIFVDKSGIWHIQGAPVLPQTVLGKMDVIWNTTADPQHILDQYQVPYIGADALTSGVLSHRILLKKSLSDFKTPIHQEVNPDTDVYKLFRTFPMPAMVKYFGKPDINLVKTIDDLKKSITEPALIEEYISGIKTSVTVLNNYRDQDIYAFPPVEIHAKKIVAPSGFFHHIKDELVNIAKKVHQAFSMKQISHSEFIVHPKRGIYLIRVNSLPDLHNDSPFAHSVHSVGATVPHVLSHVVELAISQK